MDYKCFKRELSDHRQLIHLW